jgi:hypothetical protein
MKLSVLSPLLEYPTFLSDRLVELSLKMAGIKIFLTPSPVGQESGAGDRGRA